jgi:hypothetical protein
VESVEMRVLKKPFNDKQITTNSDVNSLHKDEKWSNGIEMIIIIKKEIKIKKK